MNLFYWKNDCCCYEVARWTWGKWNVKGEILEGRKPMLAAAPALPRDQAGLWEGCAGEFLGLLLSPRAAVYLDYEHSERGFLVECTSPRRGCA